MNLASIINRHDADDLAVIDGEVRLSYGQLRERVAASRSRLALQGVRRGDRVVMLCSNSAGFIETYFAVVGLGAVAVPIDPSTPPPDLADAIGRVEPKAVVVESVQATERDRRAVGADRPTVVDVAPDDDALLVFTSGTTGAPRLVRLSHRNVVVQVAQATVLGVLGPSDKVYVGSPLWHVFGLNAVATNVFAAGATLVLDDGGEFAATAETIRRHEVSVLAGTPAMWDALSKLDDAVDVPLADNPFASVRVALSGGWEISSATCQTLHDRFGVSISRGYGLTEATGAATFSREPQSRSVGAPVAGVELRLVDRNGHDVEVGDVGEVWLRGATVSSGYYDDAAATSAAFTADGWLRTGDMAASDDAGNLYLVDRTSDRVVVGGFSVYPAEVEATLLSHPSVREAGVIGAAEAPLTERTARIHAFVVVDGSSSELDAADLIDFCQQRMAPYKCPTDVFFVDELPRHATGRLIRRNLDQSLSAA